MVSRHDLKARAGIGQWLPIQLLENSLIFQRFKHYLRLLCHYSTVLCHCSTGSFTGRDMRSLEQLFVMKPP